MNFNRLFVALNTEPWQWFESGDKDIELRCVGHQFNRETVETGRLVEPRCGYSTDDSLWSRITDVWTFDDIDELVDEIDHQRVTPGHSEEEFRESVGALMGDCSEYIAFAVEQPVEKSEHEVEDEQ